MTGGAGAPWPDDLAARIIAGAADAILYADHAGVIRYWNQGAERLFGFTAAQAVGRSLDLIIPERQRARHWQGYAEVMASGRSRYAAGDVLAVPALRADGSRISVEFTIVPVAAADGGLAGMAAILRDVTARYAELKAPRQQAAAVAGR